ncbi:N-acetyl-beta-hexosaminidase [Algoriphagus kandeliae]|uniref:beta-N-acetylhexosaminidase n=1 Tax=Algoriphagus kandeliae TaxID=2562278 RepID=A0A4Y9QNE7_9BACT|nr:family 20 glycosylhydrolase [Algoriphagus kandeliae]TFV94174.1 N-acetyl-beta-hexosaminidase [Algoriphagus kandeliae]
MNRFILSFFLIFSIMIGACEAQTDNKKGLNIEWELLENQLDADTYHQAQFVIENHSGQSIEAGWKLYFNSIFFDLKAQLENPGIELQHLAGDFFVLTGKGKEAAIPNGETLKISYRSRNPYLKNNHAPEAPIFTLANGTIVSDIQFEKSEMSVWELQNLAADSRLPIPTPARLFEQNEGLSLLPKEDLPPFLPSPKSWKINGETQWVTRAGLAVVGDKSFAEAATFLTKRIKENYNPEILKTEKPIQIRISQKDGFPSEGYSIEIRDRRVLILASDERGAFYGVQSFLGLQPADFWKGNTEGLLLPQISIEDSPAYSYRGFFLDVARNFQTKEEIFRILDLMALYKLNTFHFNLANDEGWRIEIESLPELTQYGSKRGFSEDEADFQWPFYGSGISSEETPGSGFYTQEDFKEILQYAKERQIEVIPEIGFPAHSRAAIKSMEKRYERFQKVGDLEKAEEFRLIDPDDQSEYLSAQNFRDNTVCVCKESVYHFFETVVMEMKGMYQEVGIPLKVFHTGGDEVPHGVWEKSPICQEFLAENKSLKQEDLGPYFRSRIGFFLKNEGIQQAGWEEIGQLVENGKVVPNPNFADRNWRLYAWNAVAGWEGEDMAYLLANAGFPVVISSSANYYFDLAYDWDPRERGHTWSGVGDMYQSWKTVPSKFFLSHDQTIDGAVWNWEEAKEKFENLSEEGKKNILGIQGQLWTETVKTPDMLEYYVIPKIFGLAQRAWEGDPTWASASNTEEKKALRQNEWNLFANQVAQLEVPRLEVFQGGYKIRIPAPGLKRVGDQVFANLQLPGLEIRYTSNGRVPSMQDSLYEGPIPYSPNLRFRAFSPNGQGSNVSQLED